jgi:hypothetical protein
MLASACYHTRSAQVSSEAVFVRGDDLHDLDVNEHTDRDPPAWANYSRSKSMVSPGRSCQMYRFRKKKQGINGCMSWVTVVVIEDKEDQETDAYHASHYARHSAG